MGGRFIPAGIQEEWNRFTPRVRNVFENVALVQFDHRMLAYVHHSRHSLARLLPGYYVARRLHLANICHVLIGSRLSAQEAVKYSLSTDSATKPPAGSVTSGATTAQNASARPLFDC